MTTNVLFGGLPLNVAISIPPMNTGLGGPYPSPSPAPAPAPAPGGPMNPSNCLCPLTPGNGFGNVYQGQNPVSVVALAAMPAFVAVVQGNGGVVVADPSNPAHRDIVWGINTMPVTGGQMASVVWGGPVVNPIPGTGGWNFVLNQLVYIGAAGEITQTPPSTGWVRPIGFALSQNTIYLYPTRPGVVGNQVLAPVVSVLSFSPNVVIDHNSADVFDLTLTGNTVLSMSNGIDGRIITLRVRQDGTGGRTITLDTDIVPGSEYVPVPVIGGSQARYQFQFDGATNRYICLSAATF
jgi:hypothetical protein